ncbi:MAG: MFS transporter [Bacteroidales bacterium]|nr:MFS transporter [Bacteroidales bacterium]MBQ1886192.1 MFS transporter [Bacteroidales bacterium]
MSNKGKIGFNRIGLLAIIMVFWFVISFITNILGPLIPDIINTFNLSKLTLAGFIPTSFFVAYAVMSIPAGILIEKVGEKVVLFIGFSIVLAGSVLFAFLHTYPVLLVSSFVIGLGMAMLQTVMNPLQRTVGGEENYAFVSDCSQVVFSAASFISPIVYSYYVTNPMSFAPEGMPWISLYYLFGFILVAILAVVLVTRFPKIELKSDEKSGDKSSFMELFGMRKVWLFALALFFYTGTEQGMSNNISLFLERYHGVDPHTLGATCVSWFWGSMLIGCVIGLLLLKLIDSKQLLKICCVLSAAVLAAGLFAPDSMRIAGYPVAVFALPAVGFAMSLMFPIIMSLALNSVSKHHGSFAGIMCSAIVGGAAGPLLVSMLSDAVSSQRIGMCLIFIFIAYILFIAFWAKPIVKNKLLTDKD